VGNGGYGFRLAGPSFGKGREEGGISCEMINVEWSVYAVRVYGRRGQHLPRTANLSIFFLSNTLAGRPYSGRVSPLIMRTIYGHLIVDDSVDDCLLVGTYLKSADYSLSPRTLQKKHCIT